MKGWEMIFYLVLELSMVSSVIGVITLGLKHLWKHKISPKWLMLLWVVFLVSLVNPFRWQSKFSIYNWLHYDSLVPQEFILQETFGQHTSLTREKVESLENKMEPQAEKEVTNAENQAILSSVRFSWKRILPILMYGYFSIFTMIGIAQIVTSYRMHKDTKQIWQEERLVKILEVAKQKLGIHRNIPLVKQNMVVSPAIYGMIRPKIIVSEKILQLSDEEIEIVFLHELSHMKQGDLYLHFLLRLLKNIYWFQPLIQQLLQRIRKDMELVNDEAVMEVLSEEQVKSYCKTLLKVSLFSHLEVCCGLGMGGHAKELEERIKMMKEKKQFWTNKIAIISMITVMVLGVTVCFATSQLYATKDENPWIESEDSIDEAKEYETAEETSFTGLTETVWPAGEQQTIVMQYGKRLHPILAKEIYHNGVDISGTNFQGTAIVSVANGIVEETGFLSEYGNYVLIQHPDKETNEVFETFYAHLASIQVEEGDYVAMGQQIGEGGSTGKSTGPHLHFEVRDSEGNVLDPMMFLSLEK